MIIDKVAHFTDDFVKLFLSVRGVFLVSSIFNIYLSQTAIIQIVSFVLLIILMKSLFFFSNIFDATRHSVPVPPNLIGLIVLTIPYAVLK